MPLFRAFVVAVPLKLKQTHDGCRVLPGVETLQTEAEKEFCDCECVTIFRAVGTPSTCESLHVCLCVYVILNSDSHM